MKHGNQWFKLYHDIIDDDKMDMLNNDEFRLWVTMMCLASKSVIRGRLMISNELYYTPSQLGRKAKMEVTKEVIEKFIKLELIEISPTGIVTLRNFLKRQYGKPSNAPDRIAQRVRRYRKNLNQLELRNTIGNADVTPQIKELRVKSKEYKSITQNVISLLNQLTNRNYSPKAQSVKDLITARINDSATEDDLKTVVKVKYYEWRDDPKMKDFIRPKTLFNRTNFDNYLPECRAKLTEIEQKAKAKAEMEKKKGLADVVSRLKLSGKNKCRNCGKIVDTTEEEVFESENNYGCICQKCKCKEEQ